MEGNASAYLELVYQYTTFKNEQSIANRRYNVNQ
jgi:hypothetical protein